MTTERVAPHQTWQGTDVVVSLTAPTVPPCVVTVTAGGWGAAMSLYEDHATIDVVCSVHGFIEDGESFTVAALARLEELHAAWVARNTEPTTVARP